MPNTEPELELVSCQTCHNKGYRRTNDGHGRLIEERCPTCIAHGRYPNPANTGVSNFHQNMP